jgi:hypothetical protein
MIAPDQKEIDSFLEQLGHALIDKGDAASSEVGSELSEAEDAFLAVWVVFGTLPGWRAANFLAVDIQKLFAALRTIGLPTEADAVVALSAGLPLEAPKSIVDRESALRTKSTSRTDHRSAEVRGLFNRIRDEIEADWSSASRKSETEIEFKRREFMTTVEHSLASIAGNVTGALWRYCIDHREAIEPGDWISPEVAEWFSLQTPATE